MAFIDRLEPRRLLAAVAFRPPVFYDLGAGAAAAPGRDLVVADFDRDGRADLAGTGIVTGSPGAWVMRGNGDGTFAAPLVTPLDEPPTYIPLQVADLNHDGNPDLIGAVPDPQGNILGRLRTLLGTGTGTFTVADSQLAPPGTNTGAGPVLIDFDGDGHLDLLGSGQVDVRFGTGDGTFGQRMVLGPGNVVGAPDVNGDGLQDLVTYAEPVGGYVLSVALNQGAGRFGKAGTFPTGLSLASVVRAADFDGDGVLDLAASYNSRAGGSATGFVLRGLGGGQFGPPVGAATGASGVNFVVGDFNADGRADLATPFSGLGASGPAASDAGIAFGAGKAAGGFDPVTLLSPEAPGQLAAADFDGDGQTDLAYREGADRVGVLLAAPSRSDVVLGRFGDVDGTLVPSLTVKSPSGQEATFAIKGAGSGYVLDEGAAGMGLVLERTSFDTSVKVTAPRRGREVKIHGVSVEGFLAKFDGIRDVTLSGPVEVSGEFQGLFAARAHDASITALRLDAVAIKEARNVSVTSAGPMQVVATRSWDGGFEGRPAVTAPSVLVVASTRPRREGPSLWRGDVTTTESMTGIGAFVVTGVLRDSRVRSAGAINKVALGAAVNSVVYAGVRDAVEAPQSAADFTSGSIRTLTVRGIRGTENAVTNSHFAGRRIDKVVLGRFVTSNGGTRFGLSAVEVGSYARAVSRPGRAVKARPTLPGDFDADGDYGATILA